MNHFNLIQSLESRLFMSITPGGMVHSTVPTAPTALIATASSHTVSLKWTDNTKDETGFVIQRYSAGKLTDIGTVAANVTVFTDTTAPVGVDGYLVRALAGTVRSEGSNAVTVTIKPETNVLTVLAPNKLSTAAVSTTQIYINWQGDAGATGGYTIQRSTNGTTGWTTAGKTAAGIRFFVDTNLTAKTKYFYRVVAINSTGDTATSTVFVGMTKATDSGDKKPVTTAK